VELYISMLNNVNCLRLGK